LLTSSVEQDETAFIGQQYRCCDRFLK